ncbi:MAG: hypothetical protein MUE41_09845 [Gemmatimonadaceae bacterium]|nr:hypothetical protein [Gemmatimonadaceae bacterium]
MPRLPDMRRDWRAFAVRLGDTLAALADDAFLIVDLPGDRGYVQFARTGTQGLRVETPSNHYRTEPDDLSDAAIAELISLGWSGPTHDAVAEAEGNGRPAGSSNIYRLWPRPVPYDEVAFFVVRTLTSVLGVETPRSLRYTGFSRSGESVPFPMLGVPSRDGTDDGSTRGDAASPAPTDDAANGYAASRFDGARLAKSPFFSQAHFDGRDALLPVHRIPLQIAGTPWSVFEDILAPFHTMERTSGHGFAISDVINVARDALEALRVVEVIAAGDGTRLVFRAFDEAFGLIPARRGPFLELSAPALVEIDVERTEMRAALATIEPMLPIGRVEPDHHGGVSLVTQVCADPFIALHLWHAVILMTATLPPLRDALVAAQQTLEEERRREAPRRARSARRPTE